MQAFLLNLADALIKIWFAVNQYTQQCYQKFLSANFDGRVLQLYMYNRNVRSVIKIYDYSNFFMLLYLYFKTLLYGQESLNYNLFYVYHLDGMVLVYDENIIQVISVVHKGKQRWIWIDNTMKHPDIVDILDDERNSNLLYAELNDHIDFTQYMDSFLPNIERNTIVKCREFVDIALAIHSQNLTNIKQLKMMTSDDFKEIVLKETDQISFTNE